MQRRTLFILLAWMVLFVAALLIDAPVAQSVREWGWDDKRQWSELTYVLVVLAKLPGEFSVILIIAALLVWLHPLRWRTLQTPAIATGLTSVTTLLKWLVGRRRPIVGDQPFAFDLAIGGWPGLIGTVNNLSFTSGHVALAVATACILHRLVPKYKTWFYVMTVCVGAERIFENAHYVSDVVSGAAIGWLSAHVALAIADRRGLFGRLPHDLPAVAPDIGEPRVAPATRAN